MNSRITGLGLSSVATLLLLSACVSQPQSLITTAQGQQLQHSATTGSVRYLDVGQGQKTVAAISVTIQADTNGFKTLDSSNGAPAKVLADVDSYELFLFECSSTPGVSTTEGVPTDLTDTNGVCSQKFTTTVAAQGSSGSQSFVFKNLAASAPNNYFVGVKALAGSVDPANITEYTGFSTTSADPIALSSGGVSVDANFTLSDTTPLSVSLPLLDAVGAKLETEVTVTNGSNILPTITASSLPLVN